MNSFPNLTESKQFAIPSSSITAATSILTPKSFCRQQEPGQYLDYSTRTALRARLLRDPKTGILYGQTAGVTMIDIDTPDAAHHETSVTYQTKAQALQAIESYAKHYRHTIACAVTAGGVHGYILSFLSPPNDIGLKPLQMLGCDPLYIRFCEKNGYWSDRYSPKVGRPEDPPSISHVFQYGSVLDVAVTWLQAREWLIQREFNRDA